MRIAKFLVSILLPSLFATTLLAQPYPSKPVRLLVPFGPGGVGDITSRAVMQKMSESIGQQIIIDNRPSAGGIVATETVAKSEPDGYTLYLMNNTNAVSAAMFKKLPYDTVKDFETVSTIGGFSIVVLVSPDSPAKTIKELISLAKASSGKFNIGSINIGTTQHLSAELFKSIGGLDITSVPFNNTAGVLTALRVAERSGQGQVVDLSLFEPIFSFIASEAAKTRLTGEASMRAGNHVGQGQGRQGRRFVRKAIQMRETRHGLDQRAEAWLVAVRAGLAPARDAHDHQGGIQRMQLLGGKPHLLQAARHKVFD